MSSSTGDLLTASSSVNQSGPIQMEAVRQLLTSHCKHVHHCASLVSCAAAYRVSSSLSSSLSASLSASLSSCNTSSRAGPQGKPVNLASSGGFESVWVWAVLQTIAFALALPLTIGLGMLLAWHIQLVLTNKTTIEFQEVGPRGTTLCCVAMCVSICHLFAATILDEKEGCCSWRGFTLGTRCVPKPLGQSKRCTLCSDGTESDLRWCACFSLARAGLVQESVSTRSGVGIHSTGTPTLSPTKYGHVHHNKPRCVN